LKGFSDHPFVAFGSFKYFWSNVFRRPSIKPRGMPKCGFPPIPKSDSGGRIKDIHVILGARIAGSHPNLIGFRPFKPRPYISSSVQGDRHMNVLSSI
jgi:hypothetical protein